MKKILLVISIVILVAGLFYWGNVSRKKSNVDLESMSSREVALLMTTDMATEYHIHPELAIFVNGEEVVVPINLGVTGAGMTAIHTHEEKGIIHVESPVKKDFTLGDFFAVWEKEFSRTALLDFQVNETTEIVVTVNGQKVDTYETTILRDRDKIVISYQSKP